MVISPTGFLLLDPPLRWVGNGVRDSMEMHYKGDEMSTSTDMIQKDLLRDRQLAIDFSWEGTLIWQITSPKAGRTSLAAPPKVARLLWHSLC